MFTTLFSLSLLVVLIQSVLAQDYSGFVLYTPEFVQCQSALISWTDSYNPPYDIIIVPAEDVCGEALEDLGNQTSTSMNFTVNIAAGTSVVLSILDAIGDEAWSGVVTVGGSNDTSCLKSFSSALPSSAANPSSTAYPSSTPALSTFAVSKIASTPFPSSSSSSPTDSASSVQASTSTALSTRHLSAVTFLGSAVLALVAFTL